MKSLTTVITAAFLSACGSSPSNPPNNLEPSVIRGTIVDPAKVPATIVYTTGNAGCTGQFVSETTFITAAHCIGPGQTGSGKLWNGQTITFGNCVQNPSYRGNATADHALCKVNGAYTAGKAYVVETDPAAVKKGDRVRQVGGGCTVWGGSGFGVLREAWELVVEVPSGSSRDIGTYGQPGSDAPGVPCSGDSGGTLLSVSGKLLGVTSRSDTQTRGYFSSFMSPTDQAWIKASGYLVCGIHVEAKGCPGDEPPPTPTPPTPPFVPTAQACFDVLSKAYQALYLPPFGEGKELPTQLKACLEAPKPLSGAVTTAHMPYMQ